jgi:Sulfotransferase domain
VKQPNLFIVGAPKCGTTAMHAYLGAHRNIFMSAVKEPHYFAADLASLESRVKSLDAYLELFSSAEAEHRWAGEASVWYLYSASAAADIHRFNPDARIVVMLRNPMDLVNALHLDYCCGYIETEFDLERAWNLSAARQQLTELPRACPYPQLLDYKAIAALGSQVQRLLSVFPRQQVHLIFFDDLKRSAADAYKDALRFLDLPYDGRTEFAPANESKINRARRVTNWLGIHPDRHVQWATAFKTLFGDDRFGVVRALRAMNTPPATRHATGEFRETMRRHLADDIHLLADLTGRDLGHWS